MSGNSKMSAPARSGGGVKINKMDLAATLSYKPRKRVRNVLTRMQDELKTGPFSILYRSINENLRVRVWTRSFKEVRGVCTGYIIAYDKHWNLAMYDVDELYRNPKYLLKRKKRKKRKKKIKVSTGKENETEDASLPTVPVSASSTHSDNVQPETNLPNSKPSVKSPEETLDTEEYKPEAQPATKETLAVTVETSNPMNAASIDTGPETKEMADRDAQLTNEFDNVNMDLYDVSLPSGNIPREETEMETAKKEKSDSGDDGLYTFDFQETNPPEVVESFTDKDFPSQDTKASDITKTDNIKGNLSDGNSEDHPENTSQDLEDFGTILESDDIEILQAKLEQLKEALVLLSDTESESTSDSEDSGSEEEVAVETNMSMDHSPSSKVTEVLPDSKVKAEKPMNKTDNDVKNSERVDSNSRSDMHSDQGESIDADSSAYESEGFSTTRGTDEVSELSDNEGSTDAGDSHVTEESCVDDDDNDETKDSADVTLGHVSCSDVSGDATKLEIDLGTTHSVEESVSDVTQIQGETLNVEHLQLTKSTHGHDSNGNISVKESANVHHEPSSLIDEQGTELMDTDACSPRDTSMVEESMELGRVNDSNASDLFLDLQSSSEEDTAVIKNKVNEIANSSKLKKVQFCDQTNDSDSADSTYSEHVRDEHETGDKVGLEDSVCLPDADFEPGEIISSGSETESKMLSTDRHSYIKVNTGVSNSVNESFDCTNVSESESMKPELVISVCSNKSEKESSKKSVIDSEINKPANDSIEVCRGHSSDDDNSESEGLMESDDEPPKFDTKDRKEDEKDDASDKMNFSDNDSETRENAALNCSLEIDIGVFLESGHSGDSDSRESGELTPSNSEPEDNDKEQPPQQKQQASAKDPSVQRKTHLSKRNYGDAGDTKMLDLRQKLFRKRGNTSGDLERRKLHDDGKPTRKHFDEHVRSTPRDDKDHRRDSDRKYTDERREKARDTGRDKKIESSSKRRSPERGYHRESASKPNSARSIKSDLDKTSRGESTQEEHRRESRHGIDRSIDRREDTRGARDGLRDRESNLKKESFDRRKYDRGKREYSSQGSNREREHGEQSKRKGETEDGSLRDTISHRGEERGRGQMADRRRHSTAEKRRSGERPDGHRHERDRTDDRYRESKSERDRRHDTDTKQHHAKPDQRREKASDSREDQYVKGRTKESQRSSKGRDDLSVGMRNMRYENDRPDRDKRSNSRQKEDIQEKRGLQSRRQNRSTSRDRGKRSTMGRKRSRSAEDRKHVTDRKRSGSTEGRRQIRDRKRSESTEERTSIADRKISESTEGRTSIVDRKRSRSTEGRTSILDRKGSRSAEGRTSIVDKKRSGSTEGGIIDRRVSDSTEEKISKADKKRSERDKERRHIADREMSGSTERSTVDKSISENTGQKMSKVDRKRSGSSDRSVNQEGQIDIEMKERRNIVKSDLIGESSPMRSREKKIGERVGRKEREKMPRNRSGNTTPLRDRRRSTSQEDSHDKKQIRDSDSQPYGSKDMRQSHGHSGNRSSSRERKGVYQDGMGEDKRSGNLSASQDKARESENKAQETVERRSKHKLEHRKHKALKKEKDKIESETEGDGIREEKHESSNSNNDHQQKKDRTKKSHSNRDRSGVRSRVDKGRQETAFDKETQRHKESQGSESGSIYETDRRRQHSDQRTRQREGERQIGRKGQRPDRSSSHFRDKENIRECSRKKTPFKFGEQGKRTKQVEHNWSRRGAKSQDMQHLSSSNQQKMETEGSHVPKSLDDEAEVLARHVNQLFIRGDNVVMIALVQ